MMYRCSLYYRYTKKPRRGCLRGSSLVAAVLPLGDHRTRADHVTVPNVDDRTGGDHVHFDHFRAVVRVVVERDARSGADHFAHRGDHGGDVQADGRLAVLPEASVEIGGQGHGFVSGVKGLHKFMVQYIIRH